MLVCSQLKTYEKILEFPKGTWPQDITRKLLHSWACHMPCEVQTCLYPKLTNQLWFLKSLPPSHFPFLCLSFCCVGDSWWIQRVKSTVRYQYTPEPFMCCHWAWHNNMVRFKTALGRQQASEVLWLSVSYMSKREQSAETLEVHGDSRW